MQSSNESPQRPARAARAERESARAPRVCLEPWIPSDPDVVVYEYGARLDTASAAAASEQIAKAR